MRLKERWTVSQPNSDCQRIDTLIAGGGCGWNRRYLTSRNEALRPEPLRSRTSRDTPSSAVWSGNLPEFLSPWSHDHGAVVSSGFSSRRNLVGSPLLRQSPLWAQASPWK